MPRARRGCLVFFCSFLATATTLVPAPVQGAALPDPKLLPTATTAQVPLTAAYNALSVPSRAAGSSYLDPTTGAKIYKLTSATFPTASPNWGHDYSEGGDEVSLPYNGETRAVLVRQNGGPWWLVDFNPATGVGNPRPLTGNLTPLMDLTFTFSNNPATPYYAYVSNGATIRRFDIRTMTEAPGSGWPVTGESSAMWLHQSENDGFFVWMRGANGSTVVGYEPATATLKTYTNGNLNEPRIDRAGRYVGMSMGAPLNGLVVWDWQTNSVAWSTSGDPGIPFAHNASLRRRWMTVDWNMSYPPDFGMFSSDVPNSAVHLPGPANGTTIHGNGSWIQHPANLNDQWAVFCHYGSLRPAESYWLSPGGMVLITGNGERRLLAHPYNTTSNYTFFSFAKFSSDGRYVLFTSNMNGSARSDLFLAEVPGGASQPDTTTPTVSLIAPAQGATVSDSSVTVSATAADNVGVTGVQFTLDGVNLGAQDTSAPYTVSWNTTLVANGSHTLAAVARDAAGNSTTAAPVAVTVSNTVAGPVLSAITSSGVSTSGATITWTTNVASDSQVEYGPTAAYGASTTLNATLVVAHSQTLSSLAPGTLYHYRVKSSDAGSRQTVSADFTFTTLPGSDVITYLKLDEGTGTTAADASGSGNAGTLMNGAGWSAGVQGQGAVLDGVDEYVNIPHTPALNAFPLSVTVWFKTSGTTGVTGLVNKYVAGFYDGYQLFFADGDLCAWYLRDASNYVYDGSGCSFRTTGYNNGQWHQAAFVADAVGGRLYVDGAAVGSLPWTGQAGPVTSLQDVHVGHYPGAAGGLEYLAGTVDEVRIYRRALSAGDVLQAFNDSKPPAATPTATPTATGTPTATPAPAPVIASVASSGISSAAATITWTTDVAADTQVEYGPTAAYGFSTALNPTLVASHSQALSGLLSGTLYQYRVKSKNSAGALAVSPGLTFTTTPDANLVAHLRFDEGTGTTTTDVTGHGNTGTLILGPTWTAGRDGQAVALDGVDDYVRVPHVAGLNPYPMTAAVWFNTSSATGVRGLVNKYVAASYDGYQIFLNSGNLCAWYMRNNTSYVFDGSACPLSVAGYNDGLWHQAVFVVNATGGKLYVDGALKSTLPWTGTAGAPSTTQEIHLGHYPGAAGAIYLPGAIDGFRIYKRAMGPVAILQLYSARP